MFSKIFGQFSIIKLRKDFVSYAFCFQFFGGKFNVGYKNTLQDISSFDGTLITLEDSKMIFSEFKYKKKTIKESKGFDSETSRVASKYFNLST